MVLAIAIGVNVVVGQSTYAAQDLASAAILLGIGLVGLRIFLWRICYAWTLYPDSRIEFVTLRRLYEAEVDELGIREPQFETLHWTATCDAGCVFLTPWQAEELRGRLSLTPPPNSDYAGP
jgi:hypothetical protein